MITVSVYLDMSAIWDEVRIENKNLLKQFLDYVALKNRKGRTLRQYHNDIKTFFMWNKVYNDDKEFTKVTTEDFLKFRAWGLKEFNWKSSRAIVIEAALSSFSTYIEDELHYDGFKSAIKKVKLKSHLKTAVDKIVYTDEQLQEVLDMFVSEGRCKEACIMAYAMYSGRNWFEMTQYEVSFFSPKYVYGDMLYKTPVPLKTVNGNELYCYILKEKFDPYLQLWMDYRRENNIRSKWLFPLEGDYRKPLRDNPLRDLSIRAKKYLDVPLRWELLADYAMRKFTEAGIPHDILWEIAGLSEDTLIKTYIGVK